MIEVRGQKFETVAACAAHFGLSKNHVRLFSRLGKLDRLGLKGSNGKGGRNPSPETRMRVKVRDMEFRDVYECAAHFGLSVSSVYSALSAGTIDRLGLGARGPFKGSHNPHRSKPVQIGPFKFRSMLDASRQLGLSDSYVRRAINGYSGYHMAKVMDAAMALSAKQIRARAAAIEKADRRSGRWAAE